jgi:hypothetical protein
MWDHVGEQIPDPSRRVRNPLNVAMGKEWRALPDETGHYREETLFR